MEKPDIILIVIDTLRNDAIDFQKLIKDGNPFFRQFTLYSNCVAPSPWTIPSHVTLFTGKYPLEHQIHETNSYKLPKPFAMNSSQQLLKFNTIFQTLKKEGYSNYGISTNVNLRPGTIFEKGFNVFQYFEFPYSQIDYDNFLTRLSNDLGAFSRKEMILKLAKKGRFMDLLDIYKKRHGVRTLSDNLGYPLEKGSSHILRLLGDSSIIRPFSLFLNIMEMHEPYQTKFNIYDLYKELVANENMNRAKIRKIKHEYFMEGKKIISFLANLFESFKKMGIWDNSMIIVTSDHGQSFWERGFGGHGTFLFDELIKVPLIIKYPNEIQGSFDTKLCSLIEIPELINNINIEPKSRLHGTEIVFSESYGTLHDPEWFIRGVKKKDNKHILESYESLNVRRIAVLNDKYKLCINGNDGSIQEFTVRSKTETPDRNIILSLGLLDSLEIFDRKLVLPFR